MDSQKYNQYLEDQLNDTRPAGLGHTYLDNLVRVLSNAYDFTDTKILEIGAGPFTTWDWFKDSYGISIEGIDIGYYIEQEKVAWPTEKINNMKYPCDAHKLLDFFTKETYDIVLSFHAFEHMLDLPLVVANCNKVLKSKGYLYFSLPIPSYNWGKGHWYDIPDERSMHKIITDNNFTIVYSEIINDFRYRPEVEIVCLARRND